MNKKLVLASSTLLMVPVISVISCSSNEVVALTEQQKYYASMESWVTNPKKFIIEAPLTGSLPNDRFKAIEAETKNNYRRINDEQTFINELGLSRFEMIDRPDGILIDYRIILRTPNVPMGMPFEYYVYIRCTISTGEIISFRHNVVLRSSDFSGQNTLDEMNNKVEVNVGATPSKTYFQLMNLSRTYESGALIQDQTRANDLAKILGIESIIFGDIPTDYIIRLFIEEVDGIEYGEIGQFNIIVSATIKHFEYMTSTNEYRLMSSDLKQHTDREVVDQILSEINVSENLVTKTYEELDAIIGEDEFNEDVNLLLGNPINIPSDLLGASLSYTMFRNHAEPGERVFYDVVIWVRKGIEWDTIEFTLQSTNVYVSQKKGKYE